MKNIFVLVFLCSCVLVSGCQSRTLYKESRLMMGTFIEVISPEKKAAGIVFGECGRIESLLNKYKPVSEVARLNRLGKLRVSPETFYIIKRAKEFCKSTNGAFDITIAPLMDIWGFTDKKYRLPGRDEINGALKLVGSEKIILNERDNVVEFMLPGMKIDLGAIAKGYAIDCAIKKLRENNINSCLIAGGQVYALGDKFGSPWKVAIKSPRGGGFSGYIELKNKSVATSGDYEQYFICAGRRYSHILNPKTGYPADSGIFSATVIAPDGLTADSLSTAIFVLGRKEGEELIKKFPGIESRIIEEKNVSHN